MARRDPQSGMLGNFEGWKGGIVKHDCGQSGESSEDMKGKRLWLEH